MADHGGAADADGGHRGRNRHGVIPGLGYLAADEGEGASQHVYVAFPGIGRSVVDHGVDHHAAVPTQREGSVIGEDDAQLAVGGGLNHVVLEDGNALGGRHFRAVGAGDGDAAGKVVHLTDGAARIICGTLSLGILSRRKRSGQARRQISADYRAVFRHQIRR